MKKAQRWTELLLGLIFIGVLTVPLSAQVEEGVPIGLNRVVELMQIIAVAPDAEKETVVTVLERFMDYLVSFIDDQEIPSEVLDQIEQIEDRFEDELDMFEEGLITAAVFGERVTALAGELLARAYEGGVREVPVELLLLIGISAETIEALRDAGKLSGVEVARQIMAAEEDYDDEDDPEDNNDDEDDPEDNDDEDDPED